MSDNQSTGVSHGAPLDLDAIQKRIEQFYGNSVAGDEPWMLDLCELLTEAVALQAELARLQSTLVAQEQRYSDLVENCDYVIFGVWDRERQCWASDREWVGLSRDLEAYALDEFKGAKLVYCDMEGWAIGDDGYLVLLDECGNYASADPKRYEIRFDPKWLATQGHASAERWRERALKAESTLAQQQEQNAAYESERREFTARLVECGMKRHEAEASLSALQEQRDFARTELQRILEKYSALQEQIKGLKRYKYPQEIMDAQLRERATLSFVRADELDALAALHPKEHTK